MNQYNLLNTGYIRSDRISNKKFPRRLIRDSNLQTLDARILTSDHVDLLLENTWSRKQKERNYSNFFSAIKIWRNIMMIISELASSTSFPWIVFFRIFILLCHWNHIRYQTAFFHQAAWWLSWNESYVQSTYFVLYNWPALHKRLKPHDGGANFLHMLKFWRWNSSLISWQVHVRNPWRFCPVHFFLFVIRWKEYVIGKSVKL